MGSVSRDIPEDVITVILSRLPVKSLLRCKSVCKSWLSVISNPGFIKSHLHNAIIASRKIPKIANILDPGQFLEMQDLSFTCPVHIDLIVMPRLLYEALLVPRVIGCCNGIICLCDMSATSVYFWNPCIRQCMKIPSPPIYEGLGASINFGYDLINNDYKLFIINYSHSSDQSSIIQVYSANAGSWREFDARIKQNWMGNTSGNTTVKGVLYIQCSEGLMLFNWHKEVIVLVSFPSFTQRRLSPAMNFEGYVAMFFQCVDDESVYLWTLDDVSGQMTWRRRQCVKGNHPGSSLCLTLYLGAGLFYGRKLISPHYHNVLYDYVKNVTKICGPLCLSNNIALGYTESLVSLQGFQQVE
ncbi:putative F-box protein At1g32420 [Apium graveolens]|uniref:putative F-box protein At1g32420 n=1 Tax=Apium graveolens TaxID=4045 RepID=UPI003D7B0D4C